MRAKALTVVLIVDVIFATGVLIACLLAATAGKWDAFAALFAALIVLAAAAGTVRWRLVQRSRLDTR